MNSVPSTPSFPSTTNAETPVFMAHQQELTVCFTVGASGAFDRQSSKADIEQVLLWPGLGVPGVEYLFCVARQSSV